MSAGVTKREDLLALFGAKDYLGWGDDLRAFRLRLGEFIGIVNDGGEGGGGGDDDDDVDNDNDQLLVLQLHLLTNDYQKAYELSRVYGTGGMSDLVVATNS
jgi:hypothetical protein